MLFSHKAAQLKTATKQPAHANAKYVTGLGRRDILVSKEWIMAFTCGCANGVPVKPYCEPQPLRAFRVPISNLTLARLEN